MKRIKCTIGGDTSSRILLQPHRLTIENGSIQKSNDLIKTREYRQLFDFDNHLDDISCDWKNETINKLVVAA